MTSVSALLQQQTTTTLAAASTLLSGRQAVLRRSSHLIKRSFRHQMAPTTACASAANRVDVYCASSEVQTGLIQQLQQAAPLDGVHLHWHPIGADTAHVLSPPKPEASTTSASTNQADSSNVIPAAAQLENNLQDQASHAHGHSSQASPTQASPTQGQGSSFVGAHYMASHKRGRMGRTLMAAQEMNSTQEFMRAHLAALGDGVVLVADRQTAGKGRGGNTWTSPDGCLMFSASRLLRVPPAQAPFINYVVCLGIVKGIHDAVVESCGMDPHTRLPIAIKWPNDVYYLPNKSPSSSQQSEQHSVHSSKQHSQQQHTSPHTHVNQQITPQKIGGALIHTMWSRDCFNVVTGVGLNVSNAHPTTCIDTIVQQHLLLGLNKGSRGVSLEAASHSQSSPAVGVGKGSAGHPSSIAAARVSAALASAQAAIPAASANVSAAQAEANTGETAQGAAGSSLDGSLPGLPQVPKEVILAHVMNRLDECFSVFEVNGFEPLLPDYLKSWMHNGQQVQFQAEESHSTAHHSSTAGSSDGVGSVGALSEAGSSMDQQRDTPLSTLTIRGLSPSGFLLAVEESSGRKFELTPDGNSLDMMVGLIRRKIPASS